VRDPWLSVDLQASIEQVAGILVREGLCFQMHEDGGSYRLLFAPDAVFIHFDHWDERVRIRLTSPVLQGIGAGGAGHAVVLNRLNDLNRDHAFVKWMLVDGMLMAAHDLLGESLHGRALLNAVFALARAAADAGDALGAQTDGLRYGDAGEAQDE
jgi:hypothetical protein